MTIVEEDEDSKKAVGEEHVNENEHEIALWLRC